MHVDTGHNFPEVITFRDAAVERLGARLVVASVQDSIDTGRVVEDLRVGASRNRLQTTTLLDAIEQHGFDAVMGGARRDEEKARAKERFFSFRDEFGQWDPKNQRPELWNLYNGHHNRGEHIRVFPLSNWTELDIWQYIEAEDIELPVDLLRAPAPGVPPRRHVDGGHRVPARRRGRRGVRRARALPHRRRRDVHRRGRVERDVDPRRDRRGRDRTRDRTGCDPRRRPLLGSGDGRPKARGLLLMELLRFATAGSVDDGKSTLIGRLLYDSKQIFEDTLDALEHTSRLRGEEEMNLALLTDGLRAEREQGITIDVAYRYFATPKRKFIIADTPGHIQYTRNMITGASTANLALILVDARHGIIEQSRRHAFLASLLGVPHLVLCVNKMDLVDYDQAVFERIKNEFRDFATKLDVRDLAFIPVSALRGDNVVERSDNTPWYEGTSLLHHLEEVHIGSDWNLIDCRFPVQYVIRPRDDAFHDYRGYAGQIASGTYKKGDEVVVLPSGFTSTIASIDTADGPLEEATPPMSVTIRLTDDLDVSRGDMICRLHNRPAGRPRRRRDALLVQRRRPAQAGREVRDQAHEQLGAGAGEGSSVPPRREHAAPRRDRDLALAQRDRPGHAAHDAAAALRRVPPQPRDRLVHPRRRSDEQHRRRGHDRLARARLHSA